MKLQDISMLKPSIPSKFIERIITSQTGERYRVIFQVELIGGEAKARIIGATLLPDLASAHSSAPETLCLPCSSAPVIADTAYVSDFTFEVSPFTSLLFFTSQPTRAPSVK